MVHIDHVKRPLESAVVVTGPYPDDFPQGNLEGPPLQEHLLSSPAGAVLIKLPRGRTDMKGLLVLSLWLGACASSVHDDLRRLNLTVRGRPFTLARGWPEYHSYCVLADTLHRHRRHLHTWLEFGVADGLSINLTADLLPRTQIIGFDSFEGLPRAWNKDHRKGAFSQGGIPPRGRPHVRLIKGMFRDTLPEAVATLGSIDGMNIDCDLYESTYVVLNHTYRHWRQGTLLHFHEYHAAGKGVSEEHLALVAFLRDHPEVGIQQRKTRRCGTVEPAVFVVYKVPPLPWLDGEELFGEVNAHPRNAVQEGAA